MRHGCICDVCPSIEDDSFTHFPESALFFDSCYVLSVVLRGQLIVDVPNQGHPHFGGVVASQHVANEMRLNLHLDHLQRAS